MSTLHTINKAPSNVTLWNSLSAAVLNGDAILLIEDATYAALDTAALNTLTRLIDDKSTSIYALEADAGARGLEITPDCVKAVDYQGFVKLSTEHDKVVSWHG